MTYDLQNRLLTKAYSRNTAPVTYTWDTGTGCLKGMLCQVATTASKTDYGYNVLGQTTSVIQSMADAIGNFAAYGTSTYTYDLAGNVKSIQYPSNRTIRTSK